MLKTGPPTGWSTTRFIDTHPVCFPLAVSVPLLFRHPLALLLALGFLEPPALLLVTLVVPIIT